MPLMLSLAFANRATTCTPMLARACRPLLTTRPISRCVSVRSSLEGGPDVQRLADLAQIEVTEEEVRDGPQLQDGRSLDCVSCRPGSSAVSRTQHVFFACRPRSGPPRSLRLLTGVLSVHHTSGDPSMLVWRQCSFWRRMPGMDLQIGDNQNPPVRCVARASDDRSDCVNDGSTRFGQLEAVDVEGVEASAPAITFQPNVLRPDTPRVFEDRSETISAH